VKALQPRQPNLPPLSPWAGPFPTSLSDSPTPPGSALSPSPFFFPRITGRTRAPEISGEPSTPGPHVEGSRRPTNRTPDPCTLIPPPRGRHPSPSTPAALLRRTPPTAKPGNSSTSAPGRFPSFFLTTPARATAGIAPRISADEKLRRLDSLPPVFPRSS
jgi:hypothetical protein